MLSPAKVYTVCALSNNCAEVLKLPPLRAAGAAIHLFVYGEPRDRMELMFLRSFLGKYLRINEEL